jgi:NSS family neurotransmitter:Na+ symporter
MVAQEAGENGGGVFLIQWIIFLFTWAIPLIVAEYAVGKFTRVGVPLSFVKLGGPSKLYEELGDILLCV